MKNLVFIVLLSLFTGLTHTTEWADLPEEVQDKVLKNVGLSLQDIAQWRLVLKKGKVFADINLINYFNNNPLKVSMGDGGKSLSLLKEMDKISKEHNKSPYLHVIGMRVNNNNIEILLDYCTKAISIDLSRNLIDNSLIAYYVAKKMTQLEELLLGYNNIGDSGVKQISVLTNLKKLGVEHNGISHAGVKLIAEKLTNLEELSLSENQVYNMGAEYVSGITSLKRLDMRDTGIGSTGAILITEKLDKLTWLDISNNQINLVWKDFFVNADPENILPNLKDLNFKNNYLKPDEEFSLISSSKISERIKRGLKISF